MKPPNGKKLRKIFGKAFPLAAQAVDAVVRSPSRHGFAVVYKHGYAQGRLEHLTEHSVFMALSMYAMQPGVKGVFYINQGADKRVLAYQKGDEVAYITHNMEGEYNAFVALGDEAEFENAEVV